MSDQSTRDEPLDADVLASLLDGLARGDGLDAAAGVVAAGGDEARQRREALEILGLLAAAVEPIDPPPAIRERLLAEVRGSAAPVAVMPVAAATAPAAAPVRRWALPLAASLALALAGISGYQAVQLAGQRATIDELSQRLDEVEARASSAAGVQDQLAEMRQRLALITSRGVEICALKPMAVEAGFAGPNWADSHGVLYVAPDHQHWYLTIEGLNPCKQGRAYQLWFVPADGEPVSAGTFDVGPGVRVELSSDTMPSATRAVTVTLEPAGGSPEPTGPAVLHGEEVMAIL